MLKDLEALDFLLDTLKGFDESYDLTGNMKQDLQNLTILIKEKIAAGSSCEHSKNYRSACFYAAFNPHKLTIKNLNLNDPHGIAPIFFAIYFDHLDAVKKIFSLDSTLDHQKYASVTRLTFSGTVKCRKTKFYEEDLFTAAKNNAEVYKFLLERGCAIGRKNYTTWCRSGFHQYST